jgi:hypothetical protein
MKAYIRKAKLIDATVRICRTDNGRASTLLGSAQSRLNEVMFVLTESVSKKVTLAPVILVAVDPAGFRRHTGLLQVWLCKLCVTQLNQLGDEGWKQGKRRRITKATTITILVHNLTLSIASHTQRPALIPSLMKRPPLTL